MIKNFSHWSFVTFLLFFFCLYGKEFKTSSPLPYSELLSENITDIFFLGETSSSGVLGIALAQSHLNSETKVYLLGLETSTYNNIASLRQEKIADFYTNSCQSFMLTNDGRVFSWGKKACPQLGIDLSEHLKEPKLKDISHHWEGHQVIEISNANSYPDGHTLSLTSDMMVYSWGSNHNGQLGLGNRKNRNTPTHIQELKDKSISHILSGYESSFALTKDGKIYSWGRNDFGQLGVGDKQRKLVPTLISELQNSVIVSMVAGAFHNFAIDEKSRVFAWGRNNFGQLGLGDRFDRKNPILIDKLEGVTQIFLAESFPKQCCFFQDKSFSKSCFATMKNGRVLAWGENNNGQLGLGHKNTVLEPHMVHGIEDIQKIISVHTKERKKMASYDRANYQNEEQFYSDDSIASTFFLTKFGDVYVSGNNDGGQLGLGHIREQLSPQLIPNHFFWHEEVVDIKSIVIWKVASIDMTCFPNNGKASLFDEKDVEKWKENHKGKVYSKTFALTKNGHIFIWGNHYSLTLGNINVGMEDNLFKYEVKEKNSGLNSNIDEMTSTLEGQKRYHKERVEGISDKIFKEIIEEFLNSDRVRKATEEIHKEVNQDQGDFGVELKGEL